MQKHAARLRTFAGAAAVAILASCGGGSGNDGGIESPAANASADAAYVSESDRMLAQKAQQGQLAKWSPVIQLPLVPASGAQLADGKLLFWAANSGFNWNGYGNTITALYDPATNVATSRNVTETGHDMFCPGTTRLSDGRLMVVGGYDNNRTSIYDPVNGIWSRAAATNFARGYTGTTPLADGSVLTVGGSWQTGTNGGHDAEVFTTEGTWRRLTGVPSQKFMLDGANFYGYPSDSHMNVFATGNGKVLLTGPVVDMYWIDTKGNGSFASAGRRGDDTASFANTTLMYEAGKIFKAGGATWNNNAPSNNNAYSIDTTRGVAEVRKLAPMAYPRVYANGVVLPDGQIVVIGGQTTSQEFSDNFAVMPPELYDPATDTFTLLPPISVARNYHSIAMLMADGRVVSAGGGLCQCAADHPDMQILSPPYLFNADGTAATRPVITGAPATASYGANVNVETNSAVTAFSLVRLGAVTHTVNNDQRRVSVKFEAVDSTHYRVAIPDNPGIVVPGQWMLFALNANGTPSVAKIVTISSANVPRLDNPGSLSVSSNQNVSIQLNATTSTGVIRYSATGLPPGVTIDATTGLISGKPTAGGSFLVTVRASNGTSATSTDVLIDVSTTGTGTGLLAQYFSNVSLSGTPTLQRNDAPNIPLTYDALAPGLPIDNASARWSGSIEAPATGVVQFRMTNDDGVRVWIGNQLVIDDWWERGPTARTYSMAMVSGQRYPIFVEYFEAWNSAQVQLEWQPPGATAFTPVPVARLYPAATPSTTNPALGKVATQSSVLDGGVAPRAVDGNTSGLWWENSTTITQYDNQPWWQVDLGASSRIDFIQIWSRTDCCGERLNGATVFISPTDMGLRTMAQLMADPAVIKRQLLTTTRAVPGIGVPVGTLGRHIRIQLPGMNYLSLAEVKVFGRPANYQTPTLSPVDNQRQELGSSVRLVMAASDPDGSPLTFSATGLPPGVTLDAATGVITGEPLVAGNYNATVSVRNDGNRSASVSFTWTVLGVLPQVSALAAPPAASGTSVRYAPALSGGDAQYSWDFGDGSAPSIASTNAGVEHTYAAPGVYHVTLTIQSTDGRTATYRFVQAVTAEGAGGTSTKLARSSSSLLVESRGSAAPARLWVVNPDADTVSVLDAATRARVAEIAVGSAPRTVARAADGRLWVVNRDSASISIINPSSLGVVQTVALPRGSQPYGVVFSPNGTAFVTLQASGRVLKLNGLSGVQLASLDVGNDPRHLSISGDGSQLLVSRFVTKPLPGEGTATVRTADAANAPLGGEVLVIDPATLTILRTIVLGHSERADSENQGRGIPNYLGAAAISPDGKVAWVPSKQDNIKRGMLRDGRNLTFDSTVRAASSRLDLSTFRENPAERIDHDNSSVANAALFHPSGAYLFVALETSRQVAVVDVTGRRELQRFEVGLAPQALALSGDGNTLYVSNMMSRSISVLDLVPLLSQGQTAAPEVLSIAGVATERLSAAVLKGKQLFYDARDPRLARESYMSCASCHNDGASDGRVWDMTGLGEGLRRTSSLRGRAGMGHGFLHWSANFDEIQDFEQQIRILAGGTGLMSDAAYNAETRSQPLGTAKAGMSADLDALAAYVSSLNTFAPSPFRDAAGALTPAAQAGRSLFASRSCASCHGGAPFTNSNNAGGLRDIGTIKPSSGKRLGATLTGIDIPTLRDVWSTKAYLHDGSAASLGDAVKAHGTAVPGVALTATELSNLSEYLKQIGSDEGGAP